jgi:hypothetical protein
MGIFTKAPVYSQKSMRYNKVKNSPVMKKILADKNIAKVLDEPREKREFYQALKSKSGGGVTKNEFREVVTSFREGKGKFINDKEGYAIAKKFFKSAGSRYMHSSGKSSGSLSSRELLVQGSGAVQPSSKPPSNLKTLSTISNRAVQGSSEIVSGESVSGKNTNASAVINQNNDNGQNKLQKNPAIFLDSQGVKEKKPEISSYSALEWVGKYSGKNDGSSMIVKKESDPIQNKTIKSAISREKIMGKMKEDLPKGSFSSALSNVTSKK